MRCLESFSTAFLLCISLRNGSYLIFLAALPGSFRGLIRFLSLKKKKKKVHPSKLFTLESVFHCVQLEVRGKEMRDLEKETEQGLGLTVHEVTFPA